MTTKLGRGGGGQGSDKRTRLQKFGNFADHLYEERGERYGEGEGGM